MRAQLLTTQEASVVNAMVLCRSDQEQLSSVPSYEHWGKLVAFSSVVVACDKYATFGISVSLTRSDQFVVRPIIPESALFQHLVEQWRRERGATSSITQMVLSPAYQRIIGMGSSAVPFILTAIEREGDDPDHWGWALHAITGEDPVPVEAAGDPVKIAQAWLEWGHQR